MAVNYKQAILDVASKIVEACENTEKVFFAGREAEYDEFWKIKQPNRGAKQTYTGDFGGRWTEETFKPKYDIIPSSAPYLFCGNNLKIDLVEHFEKIGKKLDFSQCTNQNSCFFMSSFTRVGNVSALGGYYYVFQDCNSLVTIDEWGDAQGREISGDGLTTTFKNCVALENIKIKGKFARDIHFHWSTKLTRASIESIVNALSSNVTGRTLQLSKTAVSNAFSDSWDDYIKTHKPEGWTVTLL